MKMYHVKDLISSTIMESGFPKTKLGYPKHLMECITNRTFLESSALNSSTLNRVADKVIAELNRKGSVDPSAFSALVVFEDKVNNILKQLTAQYHNETDAESKKQIAKIVTGYKFLSNPAQDGILKKALAASKSAPGNRLVKFISTIIQLVAEKKDGHPIEDFKAEVTHLRDAISKFYYDGFPFQATIKPYKEHLLGSDSIIEIMDKIADALIEDEPQISTMNKPVISYSDNTRGGFQKNISTGGHSPIFTDHQTNYKYESQQTFMEAFAESLDYFSRKS